jgi:hypothetical protein
MGVVATSGKTHHTIAQRSGNLADEVPGMVFKITPDELAAADRYEVSEYTRVQVALKSFWSQAGFTNGVFDPLARSGASHSDHIAALGWLAPQAAVTVTAIDEQPIASGAATLVHGHRTERQE